ncbi:hypothetical protein E1301_Tti011490 [Triplophysa tibetana]|uniref:Uncharacterized protein n=1 Tax=Triplophysa tibetana TaxID=1572043 RepID=A0A5A9PJ90_9TELE|nr:hypothetical protein E1301_Tti011490 [Triplophysa tibetana]
MDPLTDTRASPAERSVTEAASEDKADVRKRGCGREAATGGSDMEDPLEEKLKGLAFRKQISYRCISVRGFPAAVLFGASGPEAEI